MLSPDVKKLALVTGGTGSIGSEIVLFLADFGVDVIFTYYNNIDKAKEISSQNENVKFVKLDLADINSINDCTKFIKDNGQPNYLINNAGTSGDSLFENMDENKIKKVIDINLSGTMILTKKLLESIKKSKGKIINIASVSGQMGNIGQANYSASKAGIIAFTKTLAKELGSYGVTVNAVSPGLINSEMVNKIPEEVKKQIISQTALGKIGKPRDVAKLVYFLINSNYITGQVINVDGGLYYG